MNTLGMVGVGLWVSTGLTVGRRSLFRVKAAGDGVACACMACVCSPVLSWDGRGPGGSEGSGHAGDADNWSGGLGHACDMRICAPEPIIEECAAAVCVLLR